VSFRKNILFFKKNCLKAVTITCFRSVRTATHRQILNRHRFQTIFFKEKLFEDTFLKNGVFLKKVLHFKKGLFFLKKSVFFQKKLV